MGYEAPLINKSLVSSKEMKLAGTSQTKEHLLSGGVPRVNGMEIGKTWRSMYVKAYRHHLARITQTI